MLAANGTIQAMARTGNVMVVGLIKILTASLQNLAPDHYVKELTAELSHTMSRVNVSLSSAHAILQYTSALSYMAPYFAQDDQSALLGSANLALTSVDSLRNIDRTSLLKATRDTFYVSAVVLERAFDAQNIFSGTATTPGNDSPLARSFDGIYQTLLTLGTLQNKKAVAGEGAFVLDSSYISTATQKVTGNKLLSSSWQTADGSSASILLNNISEIALKQTENVNVQLSSFAVNPFAWNRDNSINSSVASLQVSDVKRSINATSALVKVKNLAIAEQVTTFTATSAGDISVDKRFMVKSNGSAVLLDILQADNVVGGLELLIRYQQAPQLEPLVFDYRFVWESNNSAGSDQQSPISNDTERKNNTANGQRRQHSFFIPGNETQPGVYYITLKSKGKTCHL
ncbi:uncharacterized protein LOC144723912 [Lampetra planeri]